MTTAPENYTSLAVGEILRRVRMERKLSLAQVEDDTRIRAVYLEALEMSDFERLPGQVYVTGFVKVYSDYLDLDSAKMTALLKSQTGHKISRPVNIFPVTSEDQRVPNLTVTIGSALLLFVILLGWKLGSAHYKNDEIPALPKELAQQMTAPQKPVETAKPQAATADEASKPKPHPVVLKAVQDVWLEIRDNTGQPIFSRVLKQGEEYWVPEQAVNYKMTTGNAGGLDVIVEGDAIQTMGRVGEVRRRVSLNPADLKLLTGAASAGTSVNKH